MNEAVATAGNSDPKVRSDCAITLHLKTEGGIIIDLKSKVQTLYGTSIRKQCFEILNFFGIRDAYLKVEDSGALPFVISARLESAVKKIVSVDKEYLPDFIEENKYTTTPDKFRFTRLYLPGNTPGLMINAGLHSPDCIILDLEDSVAPDKKDEARILVRNALRQINFYGAERMVRINQGEMGLDDLRYVIPHNVNLILIPKCESPEIIYNVEKNIAEIKNRFNLTNPVYLMPIVESALGVERSFEIASSSVNVVAVAIGLEDLTADLGVPRTAGGDESFYARSRVVMAAKASGKQPIDSVFSDVADMEGLMKNVLISKSLGFEGMGCIHPRQIPVIQKGFSPGQEEIEKSKKIITAYEDAMNKGVGVVALGSKMIDPPVVSRAQKVITLAVKMGLLSEDWIHENFEEKE
ncbi:MAG TPA: aldolase/citrate lyase family protein [Bacteroidales bacterium]|nr:aldolase/citrate lyase family protein [Bacteroidales bacterium]